MNAYTEIIERAAEMLRPLTGGNCRIGLILGSGLGGYADRLDDPRSLSYSEIEGFPVSSVPGHAGRFVVGEHAGKTVVVMQGRFHYYEGYPAAMLALGVRVMKSLGVETLLVTNAAGGVNRSFRPGTLMAITDHINFARVNPLIGENDDSYGPRFPDQSRVYDPALREALLRAAQEIGVPVEQGVYMMFTGPTFETPAEIRMARTLGADAVGMSTVPEAIAAAHCGYEILGVTLCANLAAGVLPQPLSGEEVNEMAEQSAPHFSSLILGCLERL